MNAGPRPPSSIRTSAAFTIGSNALQFGIQFISSVIIARLLSPDEMGVFSIAMAAYGLVFAFQNTGVIQYLVSQEELTPSKIGTTIGMNALQSLAFAATLIALSFGVAWILSDARIVPAVSLLAVSALLTPMIQIPVGLMQRAMRFDSLFVINVASTTVNAGVAVACAMYGLSYASLAWGSIAGSLVSGSIGCALCWRQLLVAPTLEHWREYWRFGLSMLSIVIITNLCSRSSIIVLGKLTSVATVGYFGRATGIVEMVQYGLIEPLSRLVLPTLSEHKRRGEAFGKTYLRVANVITAVSWASFAGLAVLAEPLITLVYGPTWLPAAPALVLLCAARMLIEFSSCSIEVMVASDRLAAMPRLAAVKSVAGLAAFSIGATFGLVWASAGRVLESALSSILYLPQIRSATGVRQVELGSVWLFNFVATLAAIAPALGWMIAFDWPSELPILTLLALIASGVACWLIVLFLFKHEIWMQIRQVLNAPVLNRLVGNRLK